MNTQAVTDHVPTEDELAAGAVARAAEKLNAEIREAAKRGLHVEIDVHSSSEFQLARHSQISISVEKREPVRCIWMNDGA